MNLDFLRFLVLTETNMEIFNLMDPAVNSGLLMNLMKPIHFIGLYQVRTTSFQATILIKVMDYLFAVLRIINL